MKKPTDIANATRLVLIIVFVVIAAAAPARAQEIRITVSQTMALNNERVEPSGLVPLTGTQLLVADDKQPGLLVIDSTNGKISGEALPVGTVAKNLDWEAMAKDPDGNYYIIGSRSQLFTFNFDEREAKKIIPTSKPLNTKLEIEGLAVRKLDGYTEISFGIRDKSGEIKVYRSALDNAQQLSLTPFFQFKAQMTQAVAWHLSSIEYVPELRGFLIITTTENSRDNSFYGNRLWFVPEEDLPRTRPKPTDTFTDVKPLSSDVFEKEMKAEGLTVLSYDSKKNAVTLAIVYDNDLAWLTRNRAKIPGPAAMPGKLQIVEVSLSTGTMNSR